MAHAAPCRTALALIVSLRNKSDTEMLNVDFTGGIGKNNVKTAYAFKTHGSNGGRTPQATRLEMRIVKVE